jgi:hypothetical protein
VALASAASEYRRGLYGNGRRGYRRVLPCARLQRDEDEVSRHISRVVFDILECDHYDTPTRLHHQREIGRHATEILQTQDSESGLRRLLHEIVEAHVRHALWAERRAEEFAETRLLEFKGAGLGWVKMTHNVALVPASQRAVVTHRPTGGAQASSNAAFGPKLDTTGKDSESPTPDETQDNG